MNEFKQYREWCKANNLKAGYFETLKRYMSEVKHA